jgi:beta-phosphoglucomutase family hydrolase
LDRDVVWGDYDAVLFDLDGVLTPTADVHMRAWAVMFTEFLASRDQAPYSDSDYFAFLDGKPRYEGVAALLAARRIHLAPGSPSDDPATETVCGLGNRKNAVFADLLATDGVQAYPGSVDLVDRLREYGVRVAIVSSSANARHVADAAGITDRFPVVVDGIVAREQGLAGKPRPDTFAYAAAALGTVAGRAVVVEDALSGVEAGVAGGFALVIGVDRGAGAAALRQRGADLVVTDLAELVPGVPAGSR